MQLGKIIAPRSIAIVGASARPSIGLTVINALRKIGFSGPILPVNPNYELVAGVPCYPSLSDLPAVPDLVCFCVSYKRVLPEFERLPALGVQAAVIYDAGFSESGEDGRRLQSIISKLCAEGRIALCGPNCMGVLNPADCSTSFILDLRDPSLLV